MVLKQRQIGRARVLTLHRPERRNSINVELLDALRRAVDEVERDESCRVLVLEGSGGVFCTGSDLLENGGGRDAIESTARAYFTLLARFTTLPQFVVANVDGVAQAGGIGLVAAADLVCATPASTFRLPEVLVGLIPACVLPFLARRIGAQAAYRLAATAQELNADEAHALHLVDQLHADSEDGLRRTILRLERLPADATVALKRYRSELWPIAAGTADLAVSHLTQLLESGAPRDRVAAFVREGLWQEAGR